MSASVTSTSTEKKATGADAEGADKKEGAQKREKRRKKTLAQRRIIGVDGEGQDIFVCKRCGERVPAKGGPCAAGDGRGMHVLSLGCRRCGRIDPADPACTRKGPSVGRRDDEPPDGQHDLAVVADGHIYTLLSAVDEHGRLVGEVQNLNGLTHEECASMLLSLPRHTLKFGFMFSYDVTKIIEEMPSDTRFYLLRPRVREAAVCGNKDCLESLARGAKQCDSCQGTKIRKTTTPVPYNDRSYDFFHGSLTIEGLHEGRPRSSKIWDCFRFFGCAFVEALKSWSTCKAKGCDDGKGNPGLYDRVRDPKNKIDGYRCRVCGHVAPNDNVAPVATAGEIEEIAVMKKKRGAFDVEKPEDVRRYCRNECRLLARMMRRLVDAHIRARIPLKRYDGAGSTASALLTEYGVKEFKGPKHRDLDEMYPAPRRHRDADVNLALQYAIACAFFGGRFEDSVVGLVARPVHGYDISSAYPYAETHLPCLACGKWRLERRMTKAKLEMLMKRGALVLARYAVRHATLEERRRIAWCPLPFRSDKGSISYGTNFKGWSWGPEIQAALEYWEDLVQLTGDAWVYETPCWDPKSKKDEDRHRPFAFLPREYRRRNEWGKDGAGIVLKLGMNACVTGDTLVETAGGLERIDALVGAAVDIVGADGAVRLAASIYRVGEREVFRLRTAGGRDLRLTPDHLVLTENRGDVRAWELTPDDEIATSSGTDRLVSFEAAGVATVYDVTEIDTLHFVANGIVIHNSYGKTAQSIGDNPPFQSWIWAGMTTATTRGQLLGAIASAKDRWNVLAVATDGIFALEELPIKAPPKETGTSDMKKPLGGWEYKSAPAGIFLAKPGLYYSLEQKSKNAFIRARGVGRVEVEKFRALLEDGFERWDRVDPKFCVELKSRRFYGAKHSIYGRTTCPRCEKSWAGVPEQRLCPCPKNLPAEGVLVTQMIQTAGDRDAYGTWDERTVQIAFDPFPKREREGLTIRGPFAYLTVRDLGGEESAAYDVGTAKTSPEGDIARRAKEDDLEQQDWPR